jgi:hypothetical protein
MVKGEDMGQLQGSQNAVWGQARWRISWWSKEPWQQLLRPWSIELLVVLSQVIDNPVLLRVIFDCLVELVLSWAVALAPWVQWPCSNCLAQVGRQGYACALLCRHQEGQNQSCPCCAANIPACKPNAHWLEYSAVPRRALMEVTGCVDQ